MCSFQCWLKLDNPNIAHYISMSQVFDRWVILTCFRFYVSVVEGFSISGPSIFLSQVVSVKGGVNVFWFVSAFETCITERIGSLHHDISILRTLRNKTCSPERPRMIGRIKKLKLLSTGIDLSCKRRQYNKCTLTTKLLFLTTFGHVVNATL